MAIPGYLGKYELDFVKTDSFVSSMFWHISISAEESCYEAAAAQ